MNHYFQKILLTLALAGLSLTSPAQWPYVSPTTPDAQRNALKSLQAQMDWFQNATRSAPAFGGAGYDNVWQNFQALRNNYDLMKRTLTPQQVTSGGNDLAELDAGLDILQEAFTYYHQDLAAGRNITAAIRDMCQVLRQASDIWMRELNKTCNRLRVGWA